MRRGLGTLALCLVFVLPAHAQQPPPSVSDTADRPGFADSPILLGRGHIQIESGFAWEHEGRGSDLTKTFTWPQVELHAGLKPRLEVSLAWDGLVSTRRVRRTRMGAAPAGPTCDSARSSVS